jgi:NADPH-dependent 2,4-dienoyl-CoA reductase/sulfur reductase-like enzyme
MNDLRVPGTELGAERLAIDFEGRVLAGRPGETLAAALSAAGERVFRHTATDAPRGLFCGMGVCQECLVEIDGRPNQRACMTKLSRSVTVRRQSHLAKGSEIAGAMSEGAAATIVEPEVLVLGGGAGGLNAAIAAARAGARVVLVDERPVPGGQYYKQPVEAPHASGPAGDDAQFAGGRALIAEARAAGIEMPSGALVWGAFEPLDLMVFDGTASRHYRPQRLIVATGAYERGVPFPGWTLPGVMTTGAAQTLLRSYRVLPGRRILVAGNGPLNLQVALELAQAGAEVIAVAELAPPPGPIGLRALAGMAMSGPALTLKGLRYLAALGRRHIPLLRGHVVTRVERAGDTLRAQLAPWPAGNTGRGTDYLVDTVCLGYGFLPSNEILRALGCRHDYDAARGQLITARDPDCQTSVAGVFAVGDCTGLGGAPAAEAEGVIAGAAATRSLGHALTAASEQTALQARARLARERRFQAGLWTLFRAPLLTTELATPETVICRCEELTLADLTAELSAARPAIGTVKRATRAGMGRCQGRYCGPVLAALAATGQGVPIDEAAHWAPRPPAKPIRIADIAG